MDTEYSRNGSERFAIVPGSILDKGLSRNALALYLVLALHANAERECWPSQETLARILGVSDKSIRTYLRELKDAGVIACERRRYGIIYKLQDQKLTSGLSPRPEVDVRSDQKQASGRTRYKEHSNSLEKLDNLDSSLERNYVPSYCLPEAHFRSDQKLTSGLGTNGNGHKKVDMTDFESKLADFLEVYPPPQGGMPARKIVERAFHRVFYDGADLGEVVDGARRYAAFLRDHPDRPVQDPVRWLERREWEREWKAPPAKKRKRPSPVWDKAGELSVHKYGTGTRWEEFVDEARELLLREGKIPREDILAPFDIFGLIQEEVAKNGHH